jgi:transcriptional regulator with XRE-family HTH domain
MTVDTLTPIEADAEAPDRGGRRPHWVHVGPRLKSLREEANLSQKQFAALTKEVDPAGVGLSSYSINRHEQSIHAPRPGTVTLLAATLSRALGRRITEDKLRLAGRGGLALYLENIRQTQRRTKEDFYARQLGIPVARADALLASQSEWTVPELRSIGQRYLEAADLIQSVVLGVSEEGVRQAA